MNATRKNKKYYMYTEKDTSKISSKWKVSHVTVFSALAVNALITSWAVGYILVTFHYNCILYANVSLEETITYREIPAVTEITLIPNDTNNENRNPENPMSNEGRTTKNETYTFKNSTVKIFANDTVEVMTWAEIDFRTTKFSSEDKCYFVLAVPLVSLIFAAVFGTLLALCSKGGKGYPTDILTEPQRLVYPIIIVSSIFAILNIVSTNMFVKGTQAFCAQFDTFTNTERCSSLMDRFTKKFFEEGREFYLCYQIVTTTFYIGIVLWCMQIAVTLLRLFFVVDYHLNTLTLKTDEDDITEAETLPISSTSSSTETKDVITAV